MGDVGQQARREVGDGAEGDEPQPGGLAPQVAAQLDRGLRACARAGAVPRPGLRPGRCASRTVPGPARHGEARGRPGAAPGPTATPPPGRGRGRRPTADRANQRGDGEPGAGQRGPALRGRTAPPSGRTRRWAARRGCCRARGDRPRRRQLDDERRVPEVGAEGPDERGQVPGGQAAGAQRAGTGCPPARGRRGRRRRGGRAPRRSPRGRPAFVGRVRPVSVGPVRCDRVWAVSRPSRRRSATSRGSTTVSPSSVAQQPRRQQRAHRAVRATAAPTRSAWRATPDGDQRRRSSSDAHRRRALRQRRVQLGVGRAAGATGAARPSGCGSKASRAVRTRCSASSSPQARARARRTSTAATTSTVTAADQGLEVRRGSWGREARRAPRRRAAARRRGRRAPGSSTPRSSRARRAPTGPSASGRSGPGGSAGAASRRRSTGQRRRLSVRVRGRAGATTRSAPGIRGVRGLRPASQGLPDDQQQ